MKNVLTWAITMLLSFVLCGAWAADEEPTISVSAKQRYPWNGLVDVKFSITGEGDKKYATSFIAKDLVGNTNITMKTVYKSKHVLAKSIEYLTPGSYDWIWDASKDLPNGWECGKVSVIGETKILPLYVVIDLSSGENAATYQVSYLDAAPSGGWTTEHKTTKLVLRRIEPGSFKMGGTIDVTLTKPYYIGIFEITQKQCKLVIGHNASYYQYAGDTKPVDYISWNAIRGNSDTHNWPTIKTVDSNSFIGRLQSRTGQKFDLPTEAQWEYACRAGTTSKFSFGDDERACVNYMWFYDNAGGQAREVGTKRPNAWELYDMHGNICEWCLDWEDALSGGLNPEGGLSGRIRARRGGSFASGASTSSSNSRSGRDPSSTTAGYVPPWNGFRVAIHLAE